MDRFLIIHMDDMGSSHAANTAGINLFGKGIVTSSSVMVPCAYAFDFIRWWTNNEQYDTGIHFTLTSEWDNGKWRPVGDFNKTKGLWDPDSFMRQTNEDVLKHAGSDDVRHELETQIQLALKWGLKPSHFDAHMYTVMLKNEFAQIYYELAEKYNAACQFTVNEPAPKPAFSVRPIDHQMGISHLPGYGLEQKRAVFYESLKTLKAGVTLLTLHPVIDSPEIRYIIPDWKHRYDEYKLFMEDETLAEINRNHIRLINYSFMNGDS